MTSARHPADPNDPYPEDHLPSDECDHDDYETDILVGESTCLNCGHSWEQTANEIERERQRQIAHDKYCEDWEREQRSLFFRLRRFWDRMRSNWRRPTPPADEIPF